MIFSLSHLSNFSSYTISIAHVLVISLLLTSSISFFLMFTVQLFSFCKISCFVIFYLLVDKFVCFLSSYTIIQFSLSAFCLFLNFFATLFNIFIVGAALRSAIWLSSIHRIRHCTKSIIQCLICLLNSFLFMFICLLISVLNIYRDC